MGLSGISPYSHWAYGWDVVNDQRRHDQAAAETANFKRNTGPDTVSLSNVAMEMCHAMKSGFDTFAEADKESPLPSSGSEALLGKSGNGGKKVQKMSSAELLAFFESDTFRQNGIEYAKAVAFENKTDSDDEEEESDALVQALYSRKNNAADRRSTDDDEHYLAVQAKHTGNIYVNGKLGDEKELLAKMQEVKQEVRELTEIYQQILGGGGN